MGTNFDPDHSGFVIATDGETMSVFFVYDGAPGDDIVWSAPGASVDEFKWLINSAAQHLRVEVVDKTV